jgi:hypothetical protein
MAPIPQMTIQEFNALSSTKASGKLNTAQYIADIALMGAQIIGQETGKADAKKNQVFNNYLSSLDIYEKERLAKSIETASSDEDRYKIIAAVIQNSQAKRVQNLSGVLVQQEQQNRNKRIENVIIFALIGVVFIALIKKRD